MSKELAQVEALKFLYEVYTRTEEKDESVTRMRLRYLEKLEEIGLESTQTRKGKGVHGPDTGDLQR